MLLIRLIRMREGLKGLRAMSTLMLRQMIDIVGSSQGKLPDHNPDVSLQLLSEYSSRSNDC
jgi:hypothetical protein